MGCATSHSEDLHKTSLLESDKFVTSLQDVPGYFNRTIHTADFLPPKFADGESEKTEMAYTGPPSHLRNSVDFHPYWHLLQDKDYIPGETIHEGGVEVPPGLLPSTATAQELRDIEVREAISDLRARVRDTISSKLKEDEEEYLAAISSQDNGYDRRFMGDRLPPPPLPEEDYMDDIVAGVAGAGTDEADVDKLDGGDSPLAQDEKETIDFLDSVINESMTEADSETERTIGGKNENSNWSFTPSPPISEVDTIDHSVHQHGNQHNKPLPGVNLDISGSNKSSPVNSPTTFSKSVYLPEERSSFISNEVLARQMDSGEQLMQGGPGQVPNNTRAKKLPKQKSVPPPPPKRTSNVVRTNSAKAHLPPSPVERLPPHTPVTNPPPDYPPSPPLPPPVKDSPVRTNFNRSRGNSLPHAVTTKAEVHTGNVLPLVGDGSPIHQTGDTPPVSPIPKKSSVPPTPQPRSLQSTKSLDRRDSKKAPVPLPSSEPSSLQKTNTLVWGDSQQPHKGVHSPEIMQKTKSPTRRNSSPKSTPPPPAPRPKHAPPGIKPKPVRHSMIELPPETTIAEDLPSDDSGIKEEGSERGVHYIIRNLQMTDSGSSTLDRGKVGKRVPPPTSKKPARPVSMPPNAFGPPVVRPKPQRKAPNNGPVLNGRGVGRTASFGPTRRSVSDDASSEDSGSLHIRDDTTDILSQIYVGIPEGQVR